MAAPRRHHQSTTRSTTKNPRRMSRDRYVAQQRQSRQDKRRGEKYVPAITTRAQLIAAGFIKER